MRYSINGSRSITKNISKLMNLVITNSVQKFFTAFGYKKGCGESKKGFCFTNTYGCMQGEKKIHNTYKYIQVAIIF